VDGFVNLYLAPTGRQQHAARGMQRQGRDAGNTAA
jgi:hypothetical protein